MDMNEQYYEDAYINSMSKRCRCLSDRLLGVSVCVCVCVAYVCHTYSSGTMTCLHYVRGGFIPALMRARNAHEPCAAAGAMEGNAIQEQEGEAPAQLGKAHNRKIVCRGGRWAGLCEALVSGRDRCGDSLAFASLPTMRSTHRRYPPSTHGLHNLCARRPSQQSTERVYTAKDIADMLGGVQSDIETEHQRRRSLKKERLGQQEASTTVDRYADVR